VATKPGRGRALLPTLVVLGALAIAFLLFAGFYTEWRWFQSIDFEGAYTTTLLVRGGLFAGFGLLMAAAVAANMVVAYRVRPPFRAASAEQASLERYRMALEPSKRAAVVVSSGLLGLFAAGSAAAEWRTFLLWRNAREFGETDAQFGRDLGFFIFELPWLRFLVSFGFAVVILSLIAAVVTHYLYGGIRLQTPGHRTTPSATAHISVLLGIFMLLKAAGYWLDRYELAVQDGRLLTGLQYTDAQALLPAKNILVVIALVCAALFFINVFRRTWSLPIIGAGLLLLSSFAIGIVYPAIVQQFQVRPAEPARESPYIQRNIEATRSAYGLDDVQVTDYNAKPAPAESDLQAALSTTENIRLLDPALISPTYRQLQQIRGFYGFPDSLDIDRYEIDGRVRDSVVAVRELDEVPEGQQNWANLRLVYTHGFGFVGAYGNTARADGSPDFFEADIPPEGPLGIEQPRIYFGEKSPFYSIVGSQQLELDFPDDSSPTGQRDYSYTGKGGVQISNLFDRLVFATKFQEGNILLSDLIDSDSRIMWDRQPRERVQKAAPWLTVDGDPYPTVVDGRVVWIVDAYTTSNQYPYSQRTTLGEVTTDALTVTTQSVLAQRPDPVNYIRNSVKATVDAYDGTVTLYEWDRNDPMLKAWRGAFPDAVQPYEEISPELMQHLRYPEDLFKVQREILSKYHVQDPAAFYGGQDFWKVPEDPTKRAARAAQPPYYLTLAMPGQSQASFSLTTTFAPAKRETLAAFMAVNAQPGEDFGTIRVLQLPRSTTIPGPGQVQNNFESDPDVSSQLSLLRRGGSDVELGNLLTLPVAGGLLYVEPVYVRAAQGESFPLLRKVLASYGNEIAFENTIEEALSALFRGDGTTAPPPTDPGTPTEPPSGGDALTQALADAQQALTDSEAALKAGDFAAYGEAQQRLADAISRAAAAAGAEASPSPTPTPSAPSA